MSTTPAMRALWHDLTCQIRRRWLRRRIHMPFWAEDSTAQMLGVATFGCHRCGRGAIEERDGCLRLLDAIQGADR